MRGLFGDRANRMELTGSSAAPRTDEQVRQLLRLIPRYRVLLFNDDEHTMDEVVAALLRTVLTLTVDDAFRIMLEAHTNGQSEVVICPKEQAEFYREKLRSYGLAVTIEPV